jgi:hypothetical protein
MATVAAWFNRVAETPVGAEDRLDAIAAEVREFARRFPCPGIAIG